MAGIGCTGVMAIGARMVLMKACRPWWPKCTGACTRQNRENLPIRQRKSNGKPYNTPGIPAQSEVPGGLL